MTDKTDFMARLETSLAEAGKTAPVPSADLLARILSDADEHQPEAHSPAQPTGGLSRFVDRVLGGVGGWPAMAGLATASVAGLYLGMNPPALLQSIGEGYLAGGGTAFLIDASAEVALGLDAGQIAVSGEGATE